MRQHDQDYVPAAEGALVCPGKHQDCNPRTHDALACVRIRQARITVHTDFLTQTGRDASPR